MAPQAGGELLTPEAALLGLLEHPAEWSEHHGVAVDRLGERLVAVHVKDGVVPASNPWAPGAPEFASSSLDQRHAGTADVPLADALRAAHGLEYAVIEYDHAPGDVFDDIAASLAFLTEGGFVR